MVINFRAKCDFHDFTLKSNVHRFSLNQYFINWKQRKKNWFIGQGKKFQVFFTKFPHLNKISLHPFNFYLIRIFSKITVERSTSVVVSGELVKIKNKYSWKSRCTLEQKSLVLIKKHQIFDEKKIKKIHHWDKISHLHVYKKSKSIFRVVFKKWCLYRTYKSY